MATIDIGALLRLKATLEAVASLEPTDGAAEGLTNSYFRLRAHALAVVQSTDLPEAEFLALFPVIEIARMPSNLDEAAWQSAKLESAAKAAHSLTRQMAGWFDGVIQEATLERRLELEAKERIAQERKPPTGFMLPSQDAAA
jgi:hypothetical protein